MHAKLVPIASWMGKPIRVRTGTIKKPPPTPNRPASKPMKKPMKMLRMY